jgi:hypothetical protein
MMWKRTGVAVTLCAGLILFLVVFVLPFVWLVRMGWKRARMYNSGHVDVPRRS